MGMDLEWHINQHLTFVHNDERGNVAYLLISMNRCLSEINNSKSVFRWFLIRLLDSRTLAVKNKKAVGLMAQLSVG